MNYCSHREIGMMGEISIITINEDPAPHNALDIKDFIKGYIENPIKESIVLDISKLTSIGSEAIGSFFSYKKLCIDQGKNFTLFKPSPEILKQLERMGLDKIILIQDTIMNLLSWIYDNKEEAKKKKEDKISHLKA